MKKIKKMLSILLCFLMIISVVAVPVNVAVAETAASSYSILKFSNMNVGTKVNKGTVALPDGASLDGITAFSSGWNAYYNFDGSQEIVNVDGKTAWRINFETAMAGHNNLCDISNEFMIKIDIPSSFVPYVTGVEADITNASSNAIGVSFGLVDGSTVSWNNGMSNSFEADYYSSTKNIVIERNIADLWKRDELYAACPTLTEKWTYGTATAVYLVVVNKNCTGTEGDYILINDIKLNLSVPANQIPKEEEIKLLDYSMATVGSTVTGSTALPAGLGNVSRWDIPGCGVSDMYSGKQEIVDVNGEKAWKINFNNASQQNGWLWGSTGLMCFTVDIPSEYVPYIEKINMNVINNTAGSLLYRFGVTDGSSYGTTNTGGPYILEGKGAQKISLSMSSLGTLDSAYSATHQGNSQGKWLELDKSASKIYVVMSDSAAVANGKGSIIIKDITLTCISGGIILSSSTVSGGTVVNGKVEVPVTTEDQVVSIKIPQGTLIEASSLTYNLSSTSNSDVALKFYTDTITDSGSSGYIKKGENPWQYAIPAGAANYTSVLDFYGASGGSTCVRVFEGGWYLNNWMTNVSDHPSASEKSNITTIYLGIQGVSSPSGKIIIEGFTYENKGIKINYTAVARSTVKVENSIVPIGEKGKFTITPSSGYYINNLKVKSSLGEVLPYEVEGVSGTRGIVYSVTAPRADVNITYEIKAINKTILSTINYVGDDLVSEFTVPIKSSLVYNEAKAAFETPTDYGAYFAGIEALEKYGYTVEDLTPEFVDELFRTKHHLSKYIYKMDTKSMVKAAENSIAVKFVAVLEDVTLNQRRSPIALVTYAEFVDANGVKSKTFANYKSCSLDKLVYGENLKETFTAKRGINYASSLGADISVWEDIKAQGFDHLRIPVYLSSCLDSKGNIKEETYISIDNALRNSLECGFTVVLDVHALPANLCGDYSGSVNTVYKFWKQFAEHYSYLPLSVAFEFMNEPNTGRTQNASNPDPITSNELMSVLNNLIKNTRAIKGNENRYLVLSNNYNGAWAMGEYTSNSYVLNYKNLILDIHYYNPMDFSHSGSTWDFNADGSQKYPAGATTYDSNDIVNTMKNLKNFEATYGVEVWLGEWGAFKPDESAKVRYYGEVVDAAEANNIAWCLWEYGGGWSPYVNGVWNTSLLNALFN